MIAAKQAVTGVRGVARGQREGMPIKKDGSVRAAANGVAAVAQTIGRYGSGVVGFKLGQMGQQFILLRQTREVMADHLVRP